MFLTKRFYILVLVVILLLGGGYLFGSLFIIGQLGLLALLLALAFDGYLLYRTKVSRLSVSVPDVFLTVMITKSACV